MTVLIRRTSSKKGSLPRARKRFLLSLFWFASGYKYRSRHRFLACLALADVAALAAVGDGDERAQSHARSNSSASGALIAAVARS